jgi:hypothetical protein
MMNTCETSWWASSASDWTQFTSGGGIPYHCQAQSNSEQKIITISRFCGRVIHTTTTGHHHPCSHVVATRYRYEPPHYGAHMTKSGRQPLPQEIVERHYIKWAKRWWLQAVDKGTEPSAYIVPSAVGTASIGRTWPSTYMVSRWYMIAVGIETPLVKK